MVLTTLRLTPSQDHRHHTCNRSPYTTLFQMIVQLQWTFFCFRCFFLIFIFRIHAWTCFNFQFVEPHTRNKTKTEKKNTTHLTILFSWLFYLNCLWLEHLRWLSHRGSTSLRAQHEYNTNFRWESRQREAAWFKEVHLTSLSSVHSICNGAGDIINSLCASTIGCGIPLFCWAYVSLRMANRTELRLCVLSSSESATKVLSS